MLDTHLVIGQVLRPQGIRGEVKVKPITADIARFQALKEALFQKEGAFEGKKVEKCRIDKDAVYLKFEGVDDRNQAETLRDELLYVDRAHAIELPEDYNFICDLIGCEGVDDEGESLGRIEEVLQPGGNDVYVFRGSPRGEVLVPALKSVVLNVDVEQKRMTLSAARLREVAVFED